MCKTDKHASDIHSVREKTPIRLVLRNNRAAPHVLQTCKNKILKTSLDQMSKKMLLNFSHKQQVLWHFLAVCCVYIKSRSAPLLRGFGEIPKKAAHDHSLPETHLLLRDFDAIAAPIRGRYNTIQANKFHPAGSCRSVSLNLITVPFSLQEERLLLPSSRPSRKRDKS